MDPQATFARFLEALRAHDRSEAKAAAADYNAWVARGGFLATTNAQRIRRLDVTRGGAGVVTMEGGATCRYRADTAGAFV